MASHLYILQKIAVVFSSRKFRVAFLNVTSLTDLVGEIFDLVLVGPDQGLQLPLPLALLLLCALCDKKNRVKGRV